MNLLYKKIITSISIVSFFVFSFLGLINVLEAATTTTNWNGSSVDSVILGNDIYYYQQDNYSWQNNESSSNNTVITPTKLNIQKGIEVSQDCGVSTTNPTYKYCMLAPIGNLLGEEITTSKGDKTTVVDLSDLGSFINKVYKFGVTIAVGLAIVMIAFGGIRMAAFDSISGKADGKEMINAAIAGLFIVLFSYVLLYTINPALISQQGLTSIFNK